MERSSSRLYSRANGRPGQARHAAPNHIKVVARFRPIVEGTATCIDELTDQSVLIEGLKQQFNFDRVFGPDSGQQAVFDDAIKPIVEGVLEGYNGCVLAYGQTGAGKSHTMMGGNTVEDRGAIPRMVEFLFAQKPESHRIRVGYLEIYNEKVRDLLDVCYPGDDLRVHELSGGGGFHVKGLIEVDVADAKQVHAVMRRGDKNRMTAPTNMNAQSSRSHSVFIVDVLGPHTRSKLVLVDLAGSEKVAKTGATGTLLEEAANINKSLSALGMVVNALAAAADQASNQEQVSADSSQASLASTQSTSSSQTSATPTTATASTGHHIPFRDSKLTRILQDSLVGNSRTCLIVHCSPSSLHLSETVSTLRFGMRAKHVRTIPRINYTPSTTNSTASTALLEQLKDEHDHTRQLLLEAHQQMNSMLKEEQSRLIAQKTRDINTMESRKRQIEALNKQIKDEEDLLEANEHYLFAEISRLEPRLSKLY